MLTGFDWYSFCYGGVSAQETAVAHDKRLVLKRSSFVSKVSSVTPATIPFKPKHSIMVVVMVCSDWFTAEYYLKLQRYPFGQTFESVMYPSREFCFI